MRRGWNRKPFLEIFEDKSGGNVKTPQAEYLEEGAIPVIDQGKSLIGGFTDDPGRVCMVKPPVIVFGDHTQCFKYVDFPFAMGADGVKVLKPKIQADTKFLFYYLNSLRLPEAGYDRHFKYLKRTEIIVPPLDQQKRIAAILDKADAFREKRRQAINKFDSLLQSTFLEMFGDPFTNPRKWQLRHFGSICKEIYRYPTYYEIPYVETGVPEIRGELILSNGELNSDTRKLRYISNETSIKFPRTILESGDLVLSVRGTIGKVGFVSKEHEGANITANLIRLSPDRSQVTPRFFWNLCRSRGFQSKLTRASSSTTISTIKAPDLKAITVPVPPIELQKRYDQFYESWAGMRQTLNSASDKSGDLFDSIQQRAFAGDLSLGVE